ncbi:GerAB/ArcD/ProY family transporter [Paenibacillus glycanilyticus]|uniref:Uncharacterized protein n=1 Tax=Paenibacillus glycanilyticus TaxID=126569 RepID=A0ABQ6GES6_9BACL|nr:GerAB/ArcD/ProY family transporter [Paenibacillus glycanilyticus]GLX67826.1 hypothetical protein MU1_21710 [Paenibacillus glycanilyticus]
MKKEEQITGRQLLTMAIMAQLGIEVLSLPHQLAENAGRDTWLSVLLSGLTAQVGIVLLWWLGSRYPTRPFYAYSSQIVGRPLGAFVNLAYGCYYAFSGFVVTALYCNTLKRWMFVITPDWMILMMLLLICGYAATSSLKRLAFISQSFMLFPVICFLLIAFSCLYGMETRNLLPVLSEGWTPVMKGIYFAFSAYVGYDLLLYAFPYVKGGKRKVLGIMSLANTCTMLFYIVVSLICTTMFGQKQLLLIPEPIVFILKNYKVEMLQSLDILFLIFYVCIVSATIYVYFYLSAKSFQNLSKKGVGKQSVWVWVIVALCLLGSFFIDEQHDLTQTSSFQDKLSILFVVGLPLLLLIISGIRGTGRRSA